MRMTTHNLVAVTTVNGTDQLHTRSGNDNYVMMPLGQQQWQDTNDIKSMEHTRTSLSWSKSVRCP